MKIFLAIIITSVATAASVLALTKLIEAIYNIKALINSYSHPDKGIREQGIAYNKDTEKLESSQSVTAQF
jgi:hypothetical protein